MIEQDFQPYNLELHGVRLPVIEIPQEDKTNLGLDSRSTNTEYLIKLCDSGFKKKVLNNKIDPKRGKEYEARCKLELEMFKKLNLVDYVLLVHDVLSWCDKEGIPKGPARGSSACSLVLYLTGCTNIDPIIYGLYFTRFVSEARAKSKIVGGVTYVSGKSMPDVDSDISYYHRDKVIKHIEEKYKGRTAKIGTQSCLTGKILIKEVSKCVLEYSEEQAKHLADLIEKHFGVVENLENTYKNNVSFQKWVDTSIENKKCFETACSLENLFKNKGCHPSGIAVSFDNIYDLMPLELSASKDIVTSYNMDEVATQVVKLDILGLKTVDVIAETCKLLKIKPEDIDINDQSIYDFLKTKDLFYGLFQIEEGLSKKVILEVKPRNIDQLAACVSISRPGAFTYIGAYKKFVNENIIEPFYPPFDNALKDTGNIIVYQEQINRICMEVYGLSPEDSDEIRRCVGKKDREGIKKWEPVIFQTGQQKNIPQEVTQKFWDTINKSADYLFNRGHGFSYATITAQTTYLKTNYPQEFFISLLRMAKFEPNPIEVISKINQELRNFGITLLPPHILNSDIDFKVVGKDILFGLGAIKGVSEKTIEKLNNFRHPHSNKFEIFAGAKEAGLSIGILASLILVGSLDIKGQKRAKVVYEAQLFNVLTEKEKQLVISLGEQFNYDLVKCLRHIRTLKTDKGKPVIKDTRYDTIKKHEAPYKEMLEFNSKNEDLSKFYMEKALLGYSYSVKLIDIYKNVAPDLITIDEVKSSLEFEKVHFMGEAVKVVSKKGKDSGRKYIRVEVSDHTGSCQVLLCDSNKFAKVEEHLEENGKPVAEGDIISIMGTVGKDIIFAQKIGVQDVLVFEKISQIKKLKTEEKSENDLPIPQ